MMRLPMRWRKIRMAAGARRERSVAPTAASPAPPEVRGVTTSVAEPVGPVGIPCKA
jgi:hypothetical protein